MGSNSFILFNDLKDPIMSLSDEEAGKLFKAIFEYRDSGIDQDLTGATQIAFIFIKQQLDRSEEHYEMICDRNRVNGAKGGRPIKPELTTIKGKKVPLANKNKHFVYLIYDYINDEYKIGETQDLKQRRYDIKRPTNNLDIIDFAISTAFDCRKLEREILHTYNHFKTSGEWFSFSEKEVKEIVCLFSQKTQWVTKKPNITLPDPNPDPKPDLKKEDNIKNMYGETNNIKLTSEEYKKCLTRYGKSNTDKAIQKLSSFKLSNDKKYKSDYGALNTWVWDSIGATEIPKPKERKSTYVPETITEEEMAETKKLIEESGGMENIFKGKIKNVRVEV